MSYNPPTETQVRIRALAEKDNEIAREHFSKLAKKRKIKRIKDKIKKYVKKYWIWVAIVVILILGYFFLPARCSLGNAWGWRFSC